MSIGTILKEREEQLGLSDAEVARRAGIQQRSYSYYVNDKQEPGYDALLRICNVLETSPNQILGYHPGIGKNEKMTEEEIYNLANEMADKIVTKIGMELDKKTYADYVKALEGMAKSAQKTSGYAYIADDIAEWYLLKHFSK